MPQPHPNATVTGAARLVAGVFGFAFAGIGLAVLGFMWLSPRDDFHAPPLFFRVFASFIALPFVAVGATAFYGALTGRPFRPPATTRPPLSPSATPPTPPAPTSTPARYQCPRCGAPLGSNTDVSPSGDVKCPFCNSWFNVHQPTT